MFKFVRRIVLIYLLSNVISQNNDFECQQQGRYSDIYDEKCRHYFLCTRTFDKNLQMSKQQCPLGTLFNKNIMRCVLERNYVCDFIKITTEDQTTISNSPETTDSSELMTTSKITYQSSWKPQTNDNLVENNPECLFILPTTTLSEVTEYFSEEQTTYTSGLPEDEPKSVDLISVSTSILLNSTLKMQTTTSTEMIPLSTAYSQDNKCTIPGKFPDMTSQNCERFIYCSKLPTGKLHNSILSCPTSTAFSFDNQRCLLRTNYQCPLTQPLSKSTITPIGIFNCIVQGSFLNQFDLNCNTYHLCYLNENGILLYRKMQCPQNLIFSSLHNKCVSSTTNICQNRLSVIPLN